MSFALLQGNREVTVRDTAEPINLTIPLVRRGMESRRGASTRLECRWWDSGGREWSANGCTTLEGEGGRSAICSCNHLTQFVVFEFPTSWQELGEHLSAALSINPLTVEAWQCLVTPSPWHAPTDGYTGATWTSIPGVWMVNAGLLLLAMTSLTCAARRDKDELEWIQALVAGRMRAERRSSVGRRTSLLRRHGAHVLTRTRSTRPSRPSFCELAAAATSVPQTRTAMAVGGGGWVVRVLARSGSRLDGAAAARTTACSSTICARRARRSAPELVRPTDHHAEATVGTVDKGVRFSVAAASPATADGNGRWSRPPELTLVSVPSNATIDTEDLEAEDMDMEEEEQEAVEAGREGERQPLRRGPLSHPLSNKLNPPALSKANSHSPTTLRAALGRSGSRLAPSSPRRSGCAAAVAAPAGRRRWIAT